MVHSATGLNRRKQRREQSIRVVSLAPAGCRGPCRRAEIGQAIQRGLQCCNDTVGADDDGPVGAGDAFHPALGGNDDRHAQRERFGNDSAA